MQRESRKGREMKAQETTERLERILNGVRSEKEAAEYIDNHTGDAYAGFSEYINDYIGENDLHVAEVVRRSNISRNYVYNILNGNRNPGRDKIIALCIGAGMNCGQINRALKIAGEGILYAKDERDARIMIAVNNGVKSVTELNLLLEGEGLAIIE